MRRFEPFAYALTISNELQDTRLLREGNHDICAEAEIPDFGLAVA